MKNINLTTPCHNAEFLILTRTEGRAYMQYEVPDEIECTADGCLNSWDAKGVADPHNRYPGQEY